MAEYSKVKDTTLSAFFSKLKAFFWHKADVVNVPLADVAFSGDYEDLINKPEGGGESEPVVYTGVWDAEHSIVSITVPYEDQGSISVGQVVKVQIGLRYVTGVIVTLESNGPANPPIGGAVALYSSFEEIEKGLYTLEIGS